MTTLKHELSVNFDYNFINELTPNNANPPIAPKPSIHVLEKIIKIIQWSRRSVLT